MKTEFSHLYDVACHTDGPSYDTGLRLRGFEVWACPPHRYRHFTEFMLVSPETFEPSIREGRPGTWDVGFVRPDGKFEVRFCSLERDDAEKLVQSRAGVHGKVSWRIRRNIFVFPDGGQADGGGYAPMDFALTAEEVAQLLAFRTEVDAEWKRRAAEWIRDEAERTDAIARACALDGLPPDTPTELECLECGAVYAEPGHVEAGGMACDRCG